MNTMVIGCIDPTMRSDLIFIERSRGAMSYYSGFLHIVVSGRSTIMIDRRNKCILRCSVSVRVKAPAIISIFRFLVSTRSYSNELLAQFPKPFGFASVVVVARALRLPADLAHVELLAERTVAVLGRTRRTGIIQPPLRLSHLCAQGHVL